MRPRTDDAGGTSRLDHQSDQRAEASKMPPLPSHRRRRTIILTFLAPQCDHAPMMRGEQVPLDHQSDQMGRGKHNAAAATPQAFFALSVNTFVPLCEHAPMMREYKPPRPSVRSMVRGIHNAAAAKRKASPRHY